MGSCDARRGQKWGNGGLCQCIPLLVQHPRGDTHCWGVHPLCILCGPVLLVQSLWEQPLRGRPLQVTCQVLLWHLYMTVATLCVCLCDAVPCEPHVTCPPSPRTLYQLCAIPLRVKRLCHPYATPPHATTPQHLV